MGLWVEAVEAGEVCGGGVVGEVGEDAGFVGCCGGGGGGEGEF